MAYAFAKRAIATAQRRPLRAQQLDVWPEASPDASTDAFPQADAIVRRVLRPICCETPSLPSYWSRVSHLNTPGTKFIVLTLELKSLEAHIHIGTLSKAPRCLVTEERGHAPSVVPSAV